MPSKLVAVVGATGTGKSSLALKIAEILSARGLTSEIINADAMQLYRGMDIGTAKLSLDQRMGVPHHLIDVLDITEESTAAEYQVMAREKILELQARGVIPILVGGSMLYVASVLNNFDFPKRDENLRAQLELDLDEFGPHELHRRLQALDPVAASRIIPENGRRVVRALEIVMLTGRPFAAKLPDEISSWQPVLEIGLAIKREVLVARLAERVMGMWQEGMLEEVRNLIPMGIREGKTASVAIGYAQALGQIDGILSETEAIDSTIRLTQRYARRQVSWFKRDTRIQWIDALEDNVLPQARKLLIADGIISS
jgi:tRNA dimethylallyltransferase